MTAPRNVLIVHAHDMGRYNSIYGHHIPTPTMSGFAAEGITFCDAHCAAPTCSPSRAAMLTGFTAHEMGMLGLAHRGFEMNDYNRHLARRLSAKGFHTVRAGLQHEYWAGVPNWGSTHEREMYDEVLKGSEKETNCDLRSAEAAAEFLKKGRGENPWFLWMGLFYPHREFLESDSERARADGVKVPDPLPDTPEVRKDMARYHATVAVADQALARVLDALEVSGQAEETLVILTTDHGIAFPDMKCNLTAHGTGITWVMRHPGHIPAGVTTDALVSHLDLVPTVLDLLDAEVPGDGHGVSLRPLIAEPESASVREDLFAEVNVHAAPEPKRSVRSKRFNYIKLMSSYGKMVLPNIDDSPSKDVWLAHGYAERALDRVQLYDLVLDPQERHNVADNPQYAEILKEMDARLERWMRKTNDPLLNGPLTIPVGSKVNPVSGASPGGAVENLREPLVVN
ncbi:MAG: sulfatase [Kiritimatiellae bacterium]|jgi:N-sulfoglucosamine sulfohydrolase|nr:sulfatase [Kiritimatiellia bacterium]